MNKKVTINFLLSTTLVLLSLTTTNLYAQTTGTGIFFQAVARDNFANPAKDRKIYVQSSIIQSTATGTKVLTEEYQTTTDATGVFSISVGQGTRIGGTSSNLAGIDWANGPYFLSLKVAITPIAPTTSWEYKNEWIDLGTTSFGAVPYALYAGTASGLEGKLSIKDTTSMLAIYAKAQAVSTLATAVGTKIASTDTAAMLAPYKKMVNEIIASNITSLTADAINGALNSKVNLVDSNTVYVTPTQLAANAFNPTAINNSIALKANTSDVTTTLATKVDKVSGKSLSTNDYTTTEKNKLAAITGANTGDQDLSTYATNTAVNTSLALKANTADVTTSLGLKANATDVNIALALKANTADVTTSLGLKANTADVTTSLGLKANTASPIFTGTLTAGDVTYPNTHGTNGQVLTTTGTGALTWATPTSSANASLLTGVVAVANGGTGQTTVPGILTTLGFSGNNVIIGKLAGTPGIGENANNVAIGGGAGKTAQGQSSISIGYVAGYANQGVNSLAIGGNAAQSNQGTQAVALGYAAGQNSQGVNSVALGAFAGNSQVANSIAINASGSALNPTNAGFYVNPVRATSATSSLLYYNTSTKEITSGAISGVDLTTAQTVGGLKTFSDQVVVPNIAFNNGNAIWQIGGDASATNFKLYQGGCCSRLEMDNLGRLAIGANYSPAYQLDVQGDARFTQNINVNGVIIGKGAGNNEESVAIGGGAMGASNVNGKRNTAVGAGAMASYNGTSWDNNTSVGYNNLPGMTSGSGNTSVGAESMMANVTGTQNTSVGNQSLINTTGNDNIGIGKRSGQTITTGSQNTIVGTDADVAVNNLNNATAIGYGANVTVSNTIQLGNADITNVKTSGAITAGSGTSSIAGSLVIGDASMTGASAALEVKSTTKGFLLPRLTTAQRDAISSPELGLMIFNTSKNIFQGFIGQRPPLYNYYTTINYGYSGLTNAGRYINQSFSAAGQEVTSVKLYIVSMLLANSGTFTFKIYDNTTNESLFTTNFTVLSSGELTIPFGSAITLPNGNCSFIITCISGSANFICNAVSGVGVTTNTYFDSIGYGLTSINNPIGATFYPQLEPSGWVNLH